MVYKILYTTIKIISYTEIVFNDLAWKWQEHEVAYFSIIYFLLIDDQAIYFLNLFNVGIFF